MSKNTLVLQPLPVIDVPPAPPTPTNEALMAAIKEHDGEAFWLLYKRHAELVRSVIARFIGDEDDCDDVLREVFEDIRDRAGYYSADKGRALGWIITLARRHALERVRCSQAISRHAAQPLQARARSTPASGHHRCHDGEVEWEGLRSWLRRAMA